MNLTTLGVVRDALRSGPLDKTRREELADALDYLIAREGWVDPDGTEPMSARVWRFVAVRLNRLGNRLVCLSNKVHRAATRAWVRSER